VYALPEENYPQIFMDDLTDKYSEMINARANAEALSSGNGMIPLNSMIDNTVDWEEEAKSREKEYLQLLGKYHGDISRLPGPIKLDLQARDAWNSQHAQNQITERIVEIDRARDHLRNDPAGYLREKGIDYGDRLGIYALEEDDKLKEKRKQLLREGNLAKTQGNYSAVQWEAAIDSQYPEYLQAGKEQMKKENSFAPFFFGYAPWDENLEGLTEEQKEIYAFLKGKDGNDLRAKAYKKQAEAENREKQKVEEAAQKEAEENRISNRYMKFQYRPDWKEKSQYVSTENGESPFIAGYEGTDRTGFDDIDYDYINKNPAAVEIVRQQDRASLPVTGSKYDRGEDRFYLEHMTENEVLAYNYIREDQGQKAADQYMEELKPILYERQRIQEEREAGEFAKDHLFQSSVSSILDSPRRGGVFWNQLGDYLEDGELDENAPYNRPIYRNRALLKKAEEVAEENMGPVGSESYRIGMGIADFLFCAFLSKKAGGFTASYTGASEEMQTLAADLTLSVMGSKAAAETVLSAQDRGLSDGQSLLLGTLAGLTEILTEKVSIDKLLDQATLGESAWGYFWQNAFTEGTEETAGDLCDLFFDLVISQDKSEWKETLLYYEALGFSEKEAFWRAVSNQAETIGIDFLEGSASGAVMSGTVVMGDKVYNFITDSAGVDAALGGGKPQSAFSRLVQREQLFPSRYDQSYSPQSPALPGGLDYKTALNFLNDSDLSLENNNFFSEDASQSRNLLEDAEREQLQREEAERGAFELFADTTEDALNSETDSGGKQTDLLADTPLTLEEKQRIIRDRVESGEYSLKQSPQGYLKHVEGTPQYNNYMRDRQKAGKPPQSKLTISESESQAIIKEYYGKGNSKETKKGVDHIEFVTVDRVVGFYYEKGEWHATRRIAIHYAKDGSHIVPVKEWNK